MRSTLGARQGEIDEARACDFGLVDIGVGGNQRGKPFGQRARRLACGLGEHHCGIGGEVAVRGILGGLENNALHARLMRHDAVMLELLDGGENAPLKTCKDVHGSSGGWSPRLT
jgi:hypothetical protein